MIEDNGHLIININIYQELFEFHFRRNLSSIVEYGSRCTKLTLGSVYFTELRILEYSYTQRKQSIFDARNQERL